MTAYLLAAAGYDRCGLYTTYQVNMVNMCDDCLRTLFMMRPKPNMYPSRGRARNRNRPLPDLASTKVSVPQCSSHLFTRHRTSELFVKAPQLDMYHWLVEPRFSVALTDK